MPYIKKSYPTGGAARVFFSIYCKHARVPLNLVSAHFSFSLFVHPRGRRERERERERVNEREV